MFSKLGGGGKPEEEKTVTAGTSVTEVLPSSGKTMKKVTVNPTPSQSKTVTPSTSQQTVSPDSGKLLSQVIVKAMEDVTSEVTAQTPMISQILSNLGFTADSASGTNKQKLQTNNANLAKIEDYLPHGAYVWKKLTAQGGDFVNFVVSDQSTAYPDGGTQDGYWYEKVVEGSKGQEIILFKPTSQITEITVGHSLGVKPSKIALCRLSGDSGNISNSLLCASNSGTSGYTYIFYGATYSSNTANRLGSNYFTATDEKITFSYQYAILSQNVTYAIIAVV